MLASLQVSLEKAGVVGGGSGLAPAMLIVKALLNLRSRARGEHLVAEIGMAPINVRPLPTLAIGTGAGLIVGTSSSVTSRSA